MPGLIFSRVETKILQLKPDGGFSSSFVCCHPQAKPSGAFAGSEIQAGCLEEGARDGHEHQPLTAFQGHSLQQFLRLFPCRDMGHTVLERRTRVAHQAKWSLGENDTQMLTISIWPLVAEMTKIFKTIYLNEKRKSNI